MFQISEAVAQMYSVKKGVLRNFAKFTGVPGTGFFLRFLRKKLKVANITTDNF